MTEKLLVIDTETCNTLEQPMPYDIGYAVCDRKGNVYVKRSFIVAEVFLDLSDVMKSAYYAAAVTNAYRHALDSVKDGKKPASCWIREMEMISHRPYSTGFYYGDPGQHYEEASYFSDADVCAVVQECDKEGNAILSQRNKFSLGDQVDLLTRDRVSPGCTAFSS